MAAKTIRISVLVVLASVVILEKLNQSKPKHPCVDLPLHKVIQYYGYPVEIHKVITEDEYILGLYRIPHGQKQPRHKTTPILLLHGLMQSSWDFVNMGKNNSLSFALADRGYDVWMANFRGTNWSRRHTVLNPDKDSEYWDFGVHEFGVYDVPALIDYVIGSTGEKSIHVLGFSQGVTSVVVMASEKPDYIKKVKFLTAVAPAVFMQGTLSPVYHFLGEYWKQVEAVLRFFNIKELFRTGGWFHTYSTFICNDNSIFASACQAQMNFLFGSSKEEKSKDFLSLTSSNSPNSISVIQLVHLLQLSRSGNCHKYDFGSVVNLEKYGRETPPIYNISAVVVPVALYYSSTDSLINFKNIDELALALPKVVKRYRVPAEMYSHFDFLYSINSVNLVYNAIIEEISKY